jgi:hypothetical protein
MNKKIYLTLILTLMTACASNADRKKDLTTEARNEPSLQTSDETRNHLISLITTDTELPDAKKQDLTAIVQKLYDDNHEIQILLNQKKSLFLKAMLASQYDSKRSKLLNDSIRDLNAEQMKNLKTAGEQMKAVLGIESQRANTMVIRMFERGGPW